MGKKVYAFLGINIGPLILKQYLEISPNFNFKPIAKKIPDESKSYAFWKTRDKYTRTQKKP